MKRLFVIQIEACDDAIETLMLLTPEQVTLLREIKKITFEAVGECKPILRVAATPEEIPFWYDQELRDDFADALQGVHDVAP